MGLAAANTLYGELGNPGNQQGRDRPATRHGLLPRPQRAANLKTFAPQSTITDGKGFALKSFQSYCPKRPHRGNSGSRDRKPRDLLWAAWRARQVMRDERTRRAVGRHLARFILVGLYTGSRHGAVCGAALMRTIGRGYVDLDRGVFYRRAPGARATKKRQPPVRLPDRLLTHLRRWKRLGIANQAVVEWNGKPVRSVRKAFAAAVQAAGLEGKITPHILRHTAATWAMQGGGDLWQIAGFLGMTVEMLERVYGHHHPDFQREAAEAVARSPGQKWDRNGVNKTRRASSNVMKIAEFSRGGR